VLRQLEGVLTADVHAAHVRQVEDAAAGTDGGVLDHNAGGVLDGHVPAGEIHHAGTKRSVHVIEGGVEEVRHRLVDGRPSTKKSVPYEENHVAAIFPRLSPRTYRQDVVQSIRAAIHEGSLTGGTPLVERRIAEDMGISRAPVR